MFSNAQQSIPERFIEKMEVDEKIKEWRHLVDDIIASYGDVLTIENCRELQIRLAPIRDELKPLLERQEHLRKSCEAFITEKKLRGPQNNA